MTLHWWMHWFWITRPPALAVATHLLLLLTTATVQAVPLPPSTLYPQVQSSHNSRTPASSSVSGNDPTFVNERPTAVYESGPMWSSPPDIEEPFYPTTASSDHVTSSDLSNENIPVTLKSISDHELPSETYPPSLDESDQMGSTNPTEFILQNSEQQQTYFGEPIVQTYSSLATGLNIDKASDEQSLEDPRHSLSGNWNMEEPRVLPLKRFQAAALVQMSDSEATPKKLESSNLIRDEIFSHHVNSDNNTNQYNIVDSIEQDKKHGQRLVPRDLGNLSEPVLPLSTSSHGSGSSDAGNSSLRKSIRNSKAIGHLPTSSSLDSYPGSKIEHVANPGKIESDGRNVQTNTELENIKDNKNISVNSDDSPNISSISDSSNHSIVNKSMSHPVQHSSSQKSTINEDDNFKSGRNKLESDSSKLTLESVNKSHNRTNGSVAPLNSNIPTDKALIAPNSNISDQNSPIMNTYRNENFTHDSATPIGSDTSDGITAFSEAGEIENLTPVQAHEAFGRSASLSHEEDTTLEPSVAPVSKSRVAASAADIPSGGLDAASITGIALGIVVFAGLTGAVSFVLYRRRYLNKPQTLNDKCSNPDSSGYIDDSTLRENSEEMYSLDNDSFLNSLEAMTIQNYWTDNVKHTKL